MATHFIFLPGMFQGHRKLWLQSMESQRVGYRAHPGPFQFHARISLNFRLRHGQLRVLISHLSCQYFSGPNSASGILWGRDMWSNTVSSMSNMQVFNHFLGNLIIYSRFHKENWLSLYWFFFFPFPSTHYFPLVAVVQCSARYVSLRSHGLQHTGLPGP